MNRPIKPNSPRADALCKLLAHGDLHRSEIMEIMGGDREEIEDALAELTLSRRVIRRPSSYCVPVFSLAKAVPVVAVSEALVLTRQTVQVVNFLKESQCL